MEGTVADIIQAGKGNRGSGVPKDVANGKITPKKEKAAAAPGTQHDASPSKKRKAQHTARVKVEEANEAYAGPGSD